MATMKEHYVALENTIMQRLKWAAGANPTLQTVIKQLTEALADNNNTTQVKNSQTSLDPIHTKR